MKRPDACMFDSRLLHLRLSKIATLLLASVSALLLLTATLAFGQERDDDIRGSIEVQRGDDLEALAKITPQQARAAALRRVPGASVEDVELENEGGFLVYEVTLHTDGEAQEVLVDAGDGSVLSVEADEEDEGEEEEAYEDDGDEEDGAYEDEEEEENDERGEESEQAELPGAVEQAFHRAYPDARITGTGVEEKEGETFYEIESRDGGTARDLLYRPDGRVYEIEEAVAVGALPAAVRRAAEERGQIAKAERISRGDVTEYEVAVRRNGETREVLLDAGGRVIEKSSEER